jgi:asparagine synthase (glutamine-hydrolysing)
MCGIFGFINYSQELNQDRCNETLKRMANVLEHRGPDAHDFWTDQNCIVNLGHRRLSIIDLTRDGQQPMHSSSNRYVIIFNGEIYNYKEVKNKILKLNNYNFKGHSDTEVILAAIEVWGIEIAVKKFIGMFAIVLFDKKMNKIHLIRDRMGEKPLYYGWVNNQFIFASELKAFKVHPMFNGEIDKNVVNLYFKYNYIPTPYSIYKKIYKLLPATILSINLNNKNEEYINYWKLSDNKNNLNDKEAIEKLEELLTKSIRRQMLATDVPIGAFLSGGVDSSIVVSIMQALADKPVNTFSIGFTERDYNEAHHAKEVARYLGTNHTELYLTPKDAYSIIPDLPIYYDEPFADSSQIPTLLVSKLAKKHVTVTLSGDGGDELFGGYERYSVMNKFSKNFNRLPNLMKSQLATAFEYFNSNLNQKIINKNSPKMSDRLFRIGELLKTKSELELYDYFLSSWKPSKKIIKGDNDLLDSFIQGQESLTFYKNNTFFEWMMYVDMHLYLPDDILVKVDRASMANSLESRVPLLDHNIVEFAHSLPLEKKIKNNSQKWILKQVMYKYLPSEIMDRPKKGFGVPVGEWIKGPLIEWSEDLLNESTISEQNILNTTLIRDMWDEHKQGKRNWQSQLWSVLMFQSWLKKNK